MADDKVKLLGQMAADTPRILGARLDKLRVLMESLEDAFGEDAILREDSLTRMNKLEEKIQSFVDDAETEIEELHTITEKLVRLAEDSAEHMSEGARRLGLEIENLDSEVKNLEEAVTNEVVHVFEAYKEINRIHQEMEGVATQRASIVVEDFADIKQRYEEATKAAGELNSAVETQYLALQDMSEKQKEHLEEEYGRWTKNLVDVYASTLNDDMLQDLEGMNEQVTELLSGAETFFQDEVAEPAKQKSDDFLSRIGIFKSTVDTAAAQTKESREWVEPTLERIEEQTNPLDDLINKARELARSYSQGGF